MNCLLRAAPCSTARRNRSEKLIFRVVTTGAEPSMQVSGIIERGGTRIMIAPMTRTSTKLAMSNTPYISSMPAMEASTPMYPTLITLKLVTTAQACRVVYAFWV